MVIFLTLNICRKLSISLISSKQWNMPLVSTFWVIWRKVMHIREAPDFWELHKNMCCAFSLRISVNFNSFIYFERKIYSLISWDKTRTKWHTKCSQNTHKMLAKKMYTQSVYLIWVYDNRPLWTRKQLMYSSGHND